MFIRLFAVNKGDQKVALQAAALLALLNSRGREPETKLGGRRQIKMAVLVI